MSYFFITLFVVILFIVYSPLVSKKRDLFWSIGTIHYWWYQCRLRWIQPAIDLEFTDAVKRQVYDFGQINKSIRRYETNLGEIVNYVNLKNNKYQVFCVSSHENHPDNKSLLYVGGKWGFVMAIKNINEIYLSNIIL